MNQSLGADKVHIRSLCSAGRFTLELAHIERIIEALIGHQLVMRRVLYDLAAVEHDDLG